MANLQSHEAGYRDLVLCLEFYSMDGGSRIQFHATVLLFRFIPDDHFCPSHLQDFHAVSFGMCENWTIIFSEEGFPSHLSTGFSFLFTRESPLNRHWVGWFPGFSTSETHGGILSIFPLIQLWPLNGPSPWVFHWWLPKRQRNPCKSSHVDVVQATFWAGNPGFSSSMSVYHSLPQLPQDPRSVNLLFLMPNVTNQWNWGDLLFNVLYLQNPWVPMVDASIHCA